MNSGEFEIETGMRQEGILSPLLITVFMNKCLREIRVGEIEKKLIHIKFHFNLQLTIDLKQHTRLLYIMC